MTDKNCGNCMDEINGTRYGCATCQWNPYWKDNHCKQPDPCADLVDGDEVYVWALNQSSDMAVKRIFKEMRHAAYSVYMGGANKFTAKDDESETWTHCLPRKEWEDKYLTAADLGVTIGD